MHHTVDALDDVDLSSLRPLILDAVCPERRPDGASVWYVEGVNDDEAAHAIGMERCEANLYTGYG